MKALRERLGYTQEQFAHFLGVSLRTVTRWEAGQSEPSFTARQWIVVLDALKRVDLTLEDLSGSVTAQQEPMLSKGG